MEQTRLGRAQQESYAKLSRWDYTISSNWNFLGEWNFQAKSLSRVKFPSFS